MSNASRSAHQVIFEWSKSGAMSKTVAALLALDLEIQKRGTLVASKEKIAAELGVHPSTAQRARILLQGAGFAYKSGRHLYASGAKTE